MTERTVCLDASFIVRYLGSPDPESIYRRKWSQWETEGYTLLAPTLMMYEVSKAFHRASVAGQIAGEEAGEFLERALNLGIQFRGDAALHREALQLAGRYRLSATYDAHYLALAQRLGLELWTGDRRLFNSVSAFLPWVKLAE
jgi:predicted nucleic acid-binding protein